jgi:hypothetical protein
MKTTTFKKIRLHYHLVLLLTVFVFFSCEKKEKEDLSRGFSNEIENFVPDSTIQTLQNLGMTIHEGKQPPTFEGSYLASPLVLLSTNVPGDWQNIGGRFADYNYHFKNQDNKNLTIELDTEGINYNNGDVISSSNGNGAFIAGYNESFTAFIILESESYLGSGDTAFARSLEVISGSITGEGIENLQMALLMLDDYGDEFDRYIPVNTGRVFHDSDSIANWAETMFKKKSGVVELAPPSVYDYLKK